MKKTKIFLKWFGIVLLVLASISAFMFFKYLKPFLDKMKHTEVIEIDKSLKIITGGGGNSGIFYGDSVLLVIDTKMDEAAINLYESVKPLISQQKLLAINTHWHPDHVGGNALFKGFKILAGNYGKEAWIKEAKGETLPNDWIKDTLVLHVNDDTLIVFNLAKNVHTSNDVMIYAKRRQILFAGDVILNKQAPVLMGDADAEAYLTVMDDLLKAFEIKTIVPGHGSIGGPEVITSFKNYFNDMKLAATDPSKETQLIEKYKDWNQLPIFMSPSATIKHFKMKLKN